MGRFYPKRDLTVTASDQRFIAQCEAMAMLARDRRGAVTAIDFLKGNRYRAESFYALEPFMVHYAFKGVEWNPSQSRVSQ